MTVSTASISFYSLHPQNTWTWTRVSQSPPLKKAALAIVGIVAVPLEMIGRCFCNAALWLYNRFTQRSILPITHPRTDSSVTLLNSIIAAEQTIPFQRLSEQEIRAKAEGTAYGQTFGDALGMFTEFLTRSQAQGLKKQRLEFYHRPDFERPHVHRFPQNGWTDDTDQFNMIVRAEVAFFADPSKTKEVRLAEQINNWLHHGLNGFSGVDGLHFTSRQAVSADPQRNRITCQGLGALTSDVLRNPQFLHNPHQAALEVWKRGNKPIQSRAAANGALMRTGMLGSMYRNNLRQAVEEAIRYAKVTHADPRCIASTVAATVVIALLHSGSSPENALWHAEEIAVRTLWEEMENVRDHLSASDQSHFQEIVHDLEQDLRFYMHADLPSLQLDDPLRMGYTFKCLGAGFYALRQAIEQSRTCVSPATNFRNAIQAIIWEAGDADTNAALAGAIVGAYLGVTAIPQSWMQDLHPQDNSVLQETLGHSQQVASRILRP